MLGITPFGMVHTVISLVAVAAGVAALVRYGEIGSRTFSGRVYLVMTVLTCLTGFFIFRHGGFGKPHALGILTLMVLAIAWCAEHWNWFGRASAYVSVVGYSLTLFFHMIPAITETATRVPVGQPWASGPEAPVVQTGVAIAFLVFLMGAVLQVRRIILARRRAGSAGPVRPAVR
ncbi:hypothetical protein [Lysobacter niastensis]|uniref:DUF2306 domain-containing protein n=1 Tax=Lysobacter niastensis TaxID=380629 RepID=A0ABS0B9G7_9GAMM|nr:hypothetical protein [Lysobacter niastensis]MBF6024321.1 hypothetical protein [Lysobacter niastensis]